MIHLRMTRPGADRRGRRRAARPHPRRDAPRPARRAPAARAVVRRPAHVRRGRRVRPRPTSPSSCPSSPSSASTRSPASSRCRCCAALLRSRHRLLKPMLLDQHVIAGIGNIYADEILHEARLRPDRMSDELGPAAERRLHAAIHRVLERRDRRRRIDPRRHPVRRPLRRMGLVPGGAQGLRPDRRALPDLRRRLDPPHGVGPTLHPLLPAMPALNACWTCTNRSPR